MIVGFPGQGGVDLSDVDFTGIGFRAQSQQAPEAIVILGRGLNQTGQSLVMKGPVRFFVWPRFGVPGTPEFYSHASDSKSVSFRLTPVRGDFAFQVAALADLDRSA